MENWARGDAYEFYIGRWSRRVAPEFLTGWPRRRGPLAGLRLRHRGPVRDHPRRTADPASVVGVDPSDGFLERARTEIGDRRTGSNRATPGRCRRRRQRRRHRQRPRAQLRPEPARAAAEFARVTRPGGWPRPTSGTTPRHAADPPLLGRRDRARPGRRGARRGPPVPGVPARGAAKAWRGGRLSATEVRAIEIPTVFTDFDDYWNPFLGGQGPAPTYVASLPEDRREALRERAAPAVAGRARRLDPSHRPGLGGPGRRP